MEASELARFIRESSKAGRLLSLADIEAEMADRDVPVPEGTTEPVSIPALVREAVSRHDDIRVILDDAGNPRYFSERSMTGSYARVLLLGDREPLEMMAEVIREHSRAYPRPVPLALFQCDPFNLSDDEIARCLEEMTGQSAYRDIARLTTSIGTAFAYSTDHLEPGYAAMLAEWADVGQAQNP